MSKRERKYNVRKKGDVAVIEEVETVEEVKELTIDQIDDRVDNIVSQKNKAQQMIDQAEVAGQELNDLLTNAISNTKDKNFKQRIKDLKKKL